ncbi:methyl-accepting chemotaxis protein [Parasalinivibrio latis]|uniref:methyl-accepting chemotaxis protein n=1 Tax=Parasalinivibrio latis TaxID=2952610 RepID=UPI0030E450F4
MKITIKTKLIISIALIVALVSAVQAWISISSLRSTTLSSIETQMHDAGTSTSSYINSWLNIRSDMLDANIPLIASGENVDREMLLTKKAGDFLSVYAGFTNGTIAWGDKTESWPADYDPRTRPWYRDAMAAGKRIITEPYRDFDGSMVISIAEPFHGQRQGVIALDVKVTDIINQILNLDLNNDGFAFLVDGENRVVAFKDNATVGKDATAIDSDLTAHKLEAMKQQGGLHSYISDSDGNEKLISVTPVEGTNWTLGVVEDQNLAYASVTNSIYYTVAASVLLFTVLALAGAAVISKLLQPLSDLNDAVSKLAQGEGDLTQRLTIVNQDEIGMLAESVNRFLTQLQQMIKHIVGQTESLTDFAADSRHLAESAASVIQHQQNDVDQIATAIHEMSATANEVASHAEMTANAAQASETSCQEGISVISENRAGIAALAGQIQDAASVIEKLDANAQSINQIVSTIQGIAEQTNLLALNAAIEAARAGEQGRGFAVVADEVRVLSRRTHDSTEEIRSMIENLQANTQQAVRTMKQSNEQAESSVTHAEKASEKLNEITLAISEISQMAFQIASAAEEQRAVTDDISRNTQAIKDVSDQVAQQAITSRTQAENIDSAVQNVRRDICRFRV